MDQCKLYEGPVVRFSGRNGATTTTFENVAELSTLITYQAVNATAAKVQLSSSSAADAAAGTGARTVCIFGLDANYDIQNETIALNGQTQVESVLSYLRVFGVQVQTAGSGYTNAGDIYCVKTGTGGTITAGVPGTLTSAWVKIPVGYGNGTSGIFTVPRGKKYQLRSLIASARGQASEVSIWTHDVGVGKALHLEISHIVGTTVEQFMVPPLHDPTLVYPITFNEKTDIYLRCLSAAANGIVSATAVLEQY